MSNTKQKPEITVEEFIEYYGEMIINHGNKSELRADLRSVIRGMLIKYEEYMNGGDDYIDKFLNENWIE
jgi:hypothetical protein